MAFGEWYIDVRFLSLFVWGGGTVAVYSKLLSDRFGTWKYRRDLRARRELLAAIALFAVAVASAVSIAAVLFGQAGAPIRGFLVTVALGAFFGAGLILVTAEKDPSA